MRYEVPQFIDIEDKIFGPLTFKQAIYLAGSAGGAFAIYYLLGKLNFIFALKLIFVAPPIALGLALSFIKINKRPFINFLESFFYYSIASKRYIWKKIEKKHQRNIERVLTKDTLVNTKKIKIPKISRSKLKDLAWSLDLEK